MRDSPSGPPGPASIYRPRLHLQSTVQPTRCRRSRMSIVQSIWAWLAAWHTAVQLTAAAAEHGHGGGMTGIERRARPSSLGTIASADSAHWARPPWLGGWAELAGCQAWVNDPRQSTSANCQARDVRVRPRTLRKACGRVQVVIGIRAAGRGSK